MRPGDAIPKAGEKALNPTLAAAIVKERPRWAAHVAAEATNVLAESAKAPDVLVDRPGEQAVVIETEHAPARTALDDALARLGAEVRRSGERIETAFAVRLPEALHTVRPADAEAALRGAVYGLKVCTANAPGEPPTVWPEAPDEWASASLPVLVDLLEVAGLSERRVADSLDTMEAAVRRTAAMVRDDATVYPDQGRRIGEALHQKEGEQTFRMAMAMLINALVFHEVVAGSHDVEPVDRLPKTGGVVRQSALLAEWKRILEEVNYWPIFAIARLVLGSLRTPAGHRVLEVLEPASAELVTLGAGTTHALASRMFQRLIADRKFLASYYTRSESAALLAELLARRLDLDWRDEDTYRGLRIGDLACGTGTLLYAAYEAVGRRMRRAGLDDAALHRGMMEDGLIGADVMPSATHLATSQLASAHPSRTFGRTRVHTMPYGEGDRAKGEEVIAIGSLEWLEGERQIALFETGGSQVSGAGEDVGARTAELRDGELDVCVMNPPFSRSTNHEAEKWDVPAPAFAGFGTSEEEQGRMSAKLAGAYRGREVRMGHGNAGLGSNFLDVAHDKVRPGGWIGFILPSALLSGGAWKDARKALDERFEDVVFVTLANAEPTGRAWSADTHMAETMLLARKRAGEGGGDAKARYVNVRRRPRTEAEALLLADAMDAPDNQGELRLTAGGPPYGSWIDGGLDEGGLGQVRDTGLCLVARGPARGEVVLPRRTAATRVPTTRLGSLGKRGPVDRDLTGGAHNGRERGPFELRRTPGAAPEYPMLWAHDATRERRMSVGPDAEGVPKTADDCPERAAAMWEAHASRFHTNRDFRLNSQPLAACLTPEPCLGGTAWPTFRLDEDEWTVPVLLWMNSTLGLVEFWWRGTKQQQGRARITISRIPDLSVLDPRALDAGQRGACERIYRDLVEKDLRPAHEAHEDPVRKELDERLYGEVLGWGRAELEGVGVVRAKWCAEPTVHGGKGGW